MAVASVGATFLEPFKAAPTPSPFAATIGGFTGAGDGTGGNHTVTWSLSGDYVWVFRWFAAGVQQSSGFSCDVNFDGGLPFGQILGHTIVVPAGVNIAREMFEPPKWIIRPIGTITLLMVRANTTGVFHAFWRSMTWPKTVLRDHSASELLAYVL